LTRINEQVASVAHNRVEAGVVAMPVITTETLAPLPASERAASAHAATHRLTHCVTIDAPADAVFGFLDDHRKLAAHMARRSWRLGFGRLTLDMRVGADRTPVLAWRGRIFALPVEVDERVVERRAPTSKRWRTIGTPRMWVLAHYAVAFTVEPRPWGSRVHLEIEYCLPPAGLPWLLGRLLGTTYARWCLDQMGDELRALDAQTHERQP
jgi:uncharacterized membrane protein